MYYIYFLFALILAGLMFFECHYKKLPKWWAAVVFAAPVTAPYFIFKSRKFQGMILFMVFLSLFTGVVAAEIYFYIQAKEKARYADLPPVTRQVIWLSDALKTSTRDLDRALGELEAMSKVESRISELKSTIDFINGLGSILEKNQLAIQQMVKFTREYKTYFVKKELNWVFQIQRFYTQRTVVRHYESLRRYMNDFRALLEFTYTNFDSITKLKDPVHLKNYDEYYLRYRRAVDAHNRFNVARIEFQNEFLLKYPQLKPYLPGTRQTDAFRLWEE